MVRVKEDIDMQHPYCKASHFLNLNTWLVVPCFEVHELCLTSVSDCTYCIIHIYINVYCSLIHQTQFFCLFNTNTALSWCPNTVHTWAWRTRSANWWVWLAGTWLLANLDDALNSPEYWKNPQKFDPENFLDKDRKFKKNEAFLPFGVGT